MPVLNAYLATVGALGVLVGFVSRRIEDVPLTEPLLALVLGVVAGPEVLGWLDLSSELEKTVLLEASRLLLAISLMGIALRYPPSHLRARIGATALLLAVVMPAMAVISALLGAAVLGLSAGSAWLLGAAVSPTDPVLASSVVSRERAQQVIPARLRQLLSLESGANDGLVFPLVVLGIVLVTGQSMGRFWVSLLWGVGGAVLIGAVLGFVAGRGVRAARRHHDIDHGVVMLFTFVLALFVLGAAKTAGTDGVLGVFVAGLAYNFAVTGAERRPEVEIDEAINRFAVLPVFTLLGVALPWSDWFSIGWPVVGFAVAVLALRRLPVIALLKRPLRYDAPAVAYYGWFGPIGASALFYLAHAHDQGATDPTIFAAGTAAIVASVVAHGITTTSGRDLYARATGADDHD